MNSRVKRVGVAAIVLAAVAVGYGVGTVFAEGVPATGALTYAGVLENDAGEPLSGTHEITVSLYDVATGGTALCVAGPTTENLVGGRFEIVLPDACADAAHADPDLWVEVVADETSLGRSKLGAVPYALEAGHAVEASEASGSLANEIENMKTDIENYGELGYLRFGNYQIVWGSVVTLASGYATFTFPVEFLDTNYSVVATSRGAGTYGGSDQTGPRTTSNVQIQGPPVVGNVDVVVIGKWN